jgi:hypothetical protein
MANARPCAVGLVGERVRCAWAKGKKKRSKKEIAKGLNVCAIRCDTDPHPRTVDHKIRAPYPAEGALIYLHVSLHDSPCTTYGDGARPL